MKIHGKEAYIIAGVAAVVLLGAWYLLFFRPVSSKLSRVNGQISSAKSSLQGKQIEIAQLRSYQKTAAQAKVDLVRLGKMLPSQGNVPSIIVELMQASKLSGLDLAGITPELPKAGTPFGLQTFTLKMCGSFFDLEDYLYRLEQYVQFRNDDFVVSGRLLQLVSIQLQRVDSDDPTLSGTLGITLKLNAYLWPVTTATSTAGGQ